MANDANRPSILTTMMDIAFIMANRGTCLIKQVGCVITDEGHHILATGYNGQPHGMSHCQEMFPCDAWRDQSKSCLAIHAEINALLRCSDVDKIHSVYVTTKPCLKCALALGNTRCQYVIFPDEQDINLIQHPLEIANGYTTTPFRF